MTYPHTAGHKGQLDTGRDGAAHASRSLGRRQAEVYAVIEELGEASPDQVAARLNRHSVHVRPRFSELKALGKVQDTGKRTATGLGGRTAIYRLSTAEEIALFNARKAAEAEKSGGAE